MSHPVSEGEGRFFAEGSIVEDLYREQVSLIDTAHESARTYQEELAAIGCVIQALYTVWDAFGEVPEIARILR